MWEETEEKRGAESLYTCSERKGRASHTASDPDVGGSALLTDALGHDSITSCERSSAARAGQSVRSMGDHSPAKARMRAL